MQSGHEQCSSLLSRRRSRHAIEKSLREVPRREAKKCLAPDSTSLDLLEPFTAFLLSHSINATETQATEGSESLLQLEYMAKSPFRSGC